MLNGALTDDCSHVYPEVRVGVESASGPLKAGMKVLLPCQFCGERAVEELTWLESSLEQTTKAFTQLLLDRDLLLFHWAPRERRKQIVRFGLRPAMRPTTHVSTGWRAPYICLADSPRWAWGLSGHQSSAPPGDWDLWQVWASRVTQPYVMPGDPDTGNGIHEVRTQHRIFKRHLWLVASRTKP
jgi:hypothetical protein